MWYLSFYDWPLSLSMMPSRFIHVTACVGIAFLFEVGPYCVVWMGRILFIHPWITGCGHVGCF